MNRAEALHNEILEKVREYYRLVHAPEQNAPFAPGESRINYAGRVFDEEELVNLVDSGLEFWLTAGRYARRFEAELAGFLQVKTALLVNSGSSANLLAFMALTSPLLGERRIRRGDEVITAACGFPTTVAPIVQYGAVPVFADVDPGTANLDPERLEAALSPRTRAVMAAHTLGNPFDVKAVKAFCERHGLWLVEDNCDALGSKYAGRFTGTWGDIGTSSFYPPHHMTMGEGGAVYTDDPLLKKILLSLRDWGRDCWCAPGTDNTCRCRFSGRFGKLPAGYDHKYVYSHFLVDSMHYWSIAPLDYIKEKNIDITIDQELSDKFLSMSLVESAIYFKENYGITDPIDKICLDIDKKMEYYYLKNMR